MLLAHNTCNSWRCSWTVDPNTCFEEKNEDLCYVKGQFSMKNQKPRSHWIDWMLSCWCRVDVVSASFNVIISDYLHYRMDQTSNEYNLYIPRVALVGSSSSSSKASSRFKDFALERGATNGEVSEISGESESEGVYGSSIHGVRIKANRNRTFSVHKAAKPVLESHSIENSFTSSKASNHSNYVRFF